MFTQISLKNFKGWENTKPLRLAPISVFFGANSSGKTSLLQSILLLKQTAESSDRSRVLHPGDDRSLVDLGTIADLIFNHSLDRSIEILLRWTLTDAIPLPPELRSDWMQFALSVALNASGTPYVRSARYDIAQSYAEMAVNDQGTYDLSTRPKLTRRKGRPWPLPPPIRFYGFPDEVVNYFQDAAWLADLVFALESQFSRVHYIGPLREYPKRSYLWGGEQPLNVGVRGELAIPALLAAREDNREIGRGQGKGRRYEPFEATIARWLQRLGMIDSFQMQRVAKHRKEYEVRVRRSPGSAEVLITDVGFGVSQLLPVLVQSYYGKPHSTLIFEQPEIHLHPHVQAGLADVFVDAVKVADVQFIIESHSEHFLRRLQRRVAEFGIDDSGISHKDVALYFCTVKDGQSHLTELEVDLFGNIKNWPSDFFGDELGDLAAMTQATLRRTSP